MRLLVLLALLLFLQIPARADMVIEQRMELDATSGPVILKFRGNLGRIDRPGQDGTTTIIMNLGTDEVLNLLHAKKVAYMGKLSAHRLRSENAMKQAGFDVASLKPEPTGKKEKIGEWDAEEYVLTVQGLTFRMWVAPNFPNGAAFKAQMARFSKANTGGALNPDAMDLPGIVVKSEGLTPMGRMVTTLVSAREQPVPDSEFGVPEDYELKAMGTPMQRK